MKKTIQGFTLIELLLVIALLTVSAALAVPVYQSFQTKNDVVLAALSIVQAERRAQILSQSGAQDAAWGVKVQTGNVVVFKGASYAGRDTAFDEITTISQTITIGGVNEVVFSKIYGIPGISGTTTLTAITGDTQTIVINSKGMINY